MFQIKRKWLVGAFMLGISCFSVSSSYAQMGIMVNDPAQEQNSLAQKLKQLEQYQTQLSQYQNQIQNTVAPFAYVYENALYELNQIQNIQYQYDSFMYYGGLQSYISNIGDPMSYSSSPCYNLSGLSGNGACGDQLFQSKSQSIKAKNKSNMGLLEILQQQGKAINNNGSNLDNLSSNLFSNNTNGQVKAIQGSNQMLQNLNNQILQNRQTQNAALQAEALDRIHKDDNESRSIMMNKALSQTSSWKNGSEVLQ